ncbi:MAG: AEC family transporter [Clostridia bacterium]|nr:AEC family transporter [Clostridia bacterium]
MDSFIFAVNAVAPIVLIVAIGYVLKKIKMMTVDFAKSANKLVFHLFLPVMLFLNVYKIEDLGGIDLGYVLYTVIALLVIFGASIPAVMCVAKKKERRGALLQAAFRSNYALIGIPLAQSLFGEEGATVATLLSAIVIPALNILAVVSLTVFRGDGGKPSVGKILLGIVKNPLIESVVAGLLVLGVRAILVRTGVEFRLSDLAPVYKTLQNLSNLATPLALLCLGAQFEFSAVKELRREILFGTLMRTVIVPVLGVGTAFVLFRNSFTGAHFAAFVAVFATPVSVSSVPMAQEMGGDSTLAGQLVVWTTLVSAFSVFLISFFLRAVGVF